MAVPVLTWGAMGSMVKEQQEFGDDTSKYLEANEVHDLFDMLLRQLIVHQPANPVKFLQERLREKPALTVCLVGPPGVNRSKYAGLLASEFGVRHISAGQLLRQKPELKQYVENGDLVPDDVVIDIITAELKKNKATGYVLDGFPRTKVQAQILAQKDCGFCHDKILLLQTNDQIVRNRYTQKMDTKTMGDVEVSELVERKLQQYHRHIHTIVELFQSVIRRIDLGGTEAASHDINANYTVVRQCLHMRPGSNAPLRPPRICILGCCASGRSTQCAKVAASFGLVHVDVAQLLRSNQKETGKVVEDIPPEFLGDEEICALVGKRLNEIDCVRKGWVLDGFPKTASQAEFLRQSHLWPTRMIHIQLEEEEVQRRVAKRKIDPVTGAAYYKSPNSVVIRQRLVQAEHDTEEVVRERFEMYKKGVEPALKVFGPVCFSITGDGDIEEVYKAIQVRLNELLPSEECQDPER